MTPHEYALLAGVCLTSAAIGAWVDSALRTARERIAVLEGRVDRLYQDMREQNIRAKTGGL